MVSSDCSMMKRTSSAMGMRDCLRGREPYGNGVSIVVVGVMSHQGERESRLQGKGTQVP